LGFDGLVMCLVLMFGFDVLVLMFGFDVLVLVFWF